MNPLPTSHRSVLWRIHFWAALLASPFVLAAVLTGVLYIFTPQIEAARHGWMEQVTPSGAMLPLDDALAAATAAAPPGSRLQSVQPAYGAQGVVRATFQAQDTAEHAAHHHVAAGKPASPVTVYVNPYSAQVIASMAADERFGHWARRLHSRLLQGDGWRWMIELAASAMMVMLISGIALWWPSARTQFLPASDARGRKAWKQWHAFTGVALSVLTLTILLTGLTWSKYAGEQIRFMRDALGQASPQVPRTLASSPADRRAPLSWQAAWSAARALAPDVQLQMSAPRNERGLWRIGSADTSAPTKRFDLLLDAYDGKARYFSGWERQTLFGKATAIGIPFHRGEFGWWNQAVLLVFGVGVLFSLISGWVMYLKRRPAGALGIPRASSANWRAAAKPLGIIGLLLCILMPVLAVSVAVVALMEVALVLSERTIASSR